MAASNGVVRINTKLDTTGFNSGMSQIMSGLKSIAGAVGLAFGVAALVKFGKECINLSSDLAEVDNVVNKSFGSLRGQMDALANESIKTLGMSRLTAYQTGSTFMSMGKSMGVAQQEAADMAIELTKLTGNMSSFYNKSQDLVSIALKSVYTGETETLKQYGIVMTEVNLKQFAMEQGITKAYSAMSQAEKVQLRYNYVMAQTAFIGDDFIDTQNSWANQTRILSEQWKEFMTVIGNGLVTVLTPVIRVLNSIVSALITFANAVGSVMSKLFGIKGQTFGVAESAENAAGGYEDMADNASDAGNAATKAGKAAKGALAGFDDLNVLQQKSGSGSDSGSGGGGGAASEIVAEDLESTEPIIDMASGWLADFFRPFKDSWDTLGWYVVDSWKYALESIKGLAEAIGQSFLEVWTNGTGEQFLKNIYLIIGNIGQIIGGLATSLTTAWQTAGVGTAIIQNIFDLMNIVLWTIHEITWATAEWAKNLDFYPILEAIRGALESLEPVFTKIGDALAWVWTEILLPLGKWLIEGAIPAGIDVISGAFDVFSGVLDVVVPLAQMLWDNFLQPVAEWTGGVIVEVLEGVANALSSIGDWISEHSEMLQNIAIIIGSIAAAITIVNTAIGIWNGIQAIYQVVTGASAAITSVLAAAMAALNIPLILITAAIAAVIAGIVLLINHFGSWDAVVEAFKGKMAELGAFISEVWNSIVAGVTSALDAIWNVIQIIWNGIVVFFTTIFLAIVALFNLYFQLIKTIVTTVFTAIKTVVTTIWNGIKTVITTVITGIKTGIQTALNTIKTVWTNVWTGLKTVTTNIFNGIWNTIKGVINSILGGIETMANGVVNGINTIIDAMNGLSFDIPDWVPEFGGKTFGFNIPKIATVSLPRLATGGITTGATLAQIGEAGREAVLPLENNTGWMNDLADKIVDAIGGIGSGTAVLEIDGSEFGRIAYPIIQNEKSRIGVSMASN